MSRAIKELLKTSVKELSELNVLDPKDSAEIIICHVLGMDRSTLYASLDKKITEKEIKIYQELIKRRKNHEPVWQIIGKVKFWGFDLYVDQNVLIPRPETELLVEKVLQEIQILNSKISNKCQNHKLENKNYDLIKNSKFKIDSKLETLASWQSGRNSKLIRILDVGTGCGAIIISLAKEVAKYKIPASRRSEQNTKYSFFASDISEKALKITKKNLVAQNVSNLIKIKKGNLLEPWISHKFDIITANLPYVPHEDMETLALDLLHYEPRIALDGGFGGLEIYEEFLKQLPNFLDEDGVAICEIGDKQGELFKKMVKKYLPEFKCEVLGDLAELDRIAIIKKV